MSDLNDPIDDEPEGDKFYARLKGMKERGGAYGVVARIWEDVTDRRGWRQAADSFDCGVKNEILDAWTQIVENLK